MKLALAGDTMLGRGVADAITSAGAGSLFGSDVIAAVAEADLVILNLECCISDRGARWPDPGKPFFFRAPPAAVDALNLLGVDCVTLANNHALDFGVEALIDTLGHLESAGITWVGAGVDVEHAHRPVVFQAGGLELGVVAFTDHPSEYAAQRDRPGVAYANLRRGVPDWITQTVAALTTDIVLVTPHWGPNMVQAPVGRIHAAAATLVRAGATLIAGHSAHVPHGVEGQVLYDLGDFLDDYATDPLLRNDLGLLFLVDCDPGSPRRLEALPLKLHYCHTRLATGDDAAWIGRRFVHACKALNTVVHQTDGRLVVDWAPPT